MPRGKTSKVYIVPASGAGLSKLATKLATTGEKAIKGAKKLKAVAEEAKAVALPGPPSAAVVPASGAGISTFLGKVAKTGQKIVKGVSKLKEVGDTAASLGGPMMAASGGGGNPWIAHVKAWRAEHGGSYKDALKNAGPSYKAKASGGGRKKKH